MTIKKPYHRNCRQFVDGHYSEGGRWQYMVHPDYAKSPEHYVRAFLLIQKDLQTLFDYVEPADVNMDCYSYRIHELLMRTCMEVEANCKAILKENIYSKEKYLNMGDYKKLNVTHGLSSYKVRLPIWDGVSHIRQPFGNWADNEPLVWYSAYNSTKHDRHNEFKNANFKNLIDAVCGLLVILSSQFHTNDFSPGPTLLACEGGYHNDGMECAIGDYFRINFPNDWPKEDRYDFNWQNIQDEQHLFQKINYDEIE